MKVCAESLPRHVLGASTVHDKCPCGLLMNPGVPGPLAATVLTPVGRDSGWDGDFPSSSSPGTVHLLWNLGSLEVVLRGKGS